jgi:succinate dehydrogenase / fumarate reductase cytochrome b subunit
MSQPHRPLSPHLQVYRLPLTALMSISHRITGVGLTGGTLLLTWWLVAAAYGSDAYSIVQAFLGSWFGYLLLFGFSFAMFFHLCNGIRHLFWDFGKYFELQQTRRADLMVLFSTFILTISTWCVVLLKGDI